MLGVCMSVRWVCIFCVCMCVCISVCLFVYVCMCVCHVPTYGWCVYNIIYTNMHVRLFVCACVGCIYMVGAYSVIKGGAIATFWAQHHSLGEKRGNNT